MSSKRFCPNCGEEPLDDGNFCGGCGTRLNPAPAPEAAPGFLNPEAAPAQAVQSSQAPSGTKKNLSQIWGAVGAVGGVILGLVIMVAKYKTGWLSNPFAPQSIVTPSPAPPPVPSRSAGPSPAPPSIARTPPNPSPRPSAVVRLTPAPTPPRIPPVPPPSASQFPRTIFLSDNFRRPANNGQPGPDYIPIFQAGAIIADDQLQNPGRDYGGVQFARRIGEEFYMKLGLLVTTDWEGHTTQAGPYFWSRNAAPRDGIIGGQSAGYWVQLDSTGEVTMKRLNPAQVVATCGRPSGFNNMVAHTLEVAVHRQSIQVALDGRLLMFDQAGGFNDVVPLPPTLGSNNGMAGVAFSAEKNRGLLGGQRVTNLFVTSYAPIRTPSAPPAPQLGP
jgi:hypothetical protein